MPTRQIFAKFTLVAVVFGLAACGGGSGSTPVMPIPPVVTPPPTPTTGLDGGGTGAPSDPLAAFSAQLTFQPTAHQGLEVVTLAAVNGVSRPTAQASPALTLTRTTTGFDMSNTAGDTRFDTRTNARTMIGTNEFRNCLGNDTCIGSGQGLRTVYFKFNNGAASTLSYSTYGRWARIEALIIPVELGVFATGLPSTTAQVPTTGTATFTGGATGFLYGPTTADSLAIQGNATLNVDFAARTVSGSISSIVTSAVTNNTQTGTLGNITLSAGSINGATFTGTATGTALAGAAQDISGSTGQFGGAFYGPNAQEAAGSFALTGPNRSVIGSFGVKR